MARLRFILSCLLFLTSLIPFSTADTPFDSYVVQPGNPNNFTIAVNVPSNSSDELFFHISSPAGQQWSAFGFGSGMAGALMFVVYSQTDNTSVTVSPRIGTGHSMPKYTDSVNITLLPGSQMVDGNLVVNAKCTGCRTWNGGSLDVTSTTQSMIWAVGPGVNFESNDVNAAIMQHDGTGMGSFTLNMQKATGDAGVPIVTGDNTSTGNSGSAGETEFPIIIHGFLMSIVFLVIFPGGYLFLRVFEKVWLHMGIQSLGLLIVTMATVSGIVISVRQDISPRLTSPHQVIGIIVFILVLAAWLLGFVGHRIYKKTKIPAVPMKVHRGVGPGAMALGLVNVGIGLNFSGRTRYIIPFYIVTLLMIIFVSSVTYLFKKRRVRKAAMETPAAQNFNQALYPDQQAPPSYQAAAGYYAPGEPVPMQTLNPPQEHIHNGSRVN